MDEYPQPRAFFKFDGNTRDLTGNCNDPTEHGTIEYVEGPHGDADGAIYLAYNAYLEWVNWYQGPLHLTNDEYTLIMWYGDFTLSNADVM